MSTLYRDYRPQNFSEVLGQNHIKITLQNEIANNRLVGAYLFCGPRAVGKTTLARVLAKAVNCETKKDGAFEPCGHCPSCLSIMAGRNLDVVEIDAASNTGVDNVRENIIAFSRLAPSSAKCKVFIIDEVHMLSLSAFNALLKIIEEPPAYVIFILCTTEIQKVPGTIISRCERFDFKKISVKETVKKLTQIAASEKIAVDQEVLEAVALRSGGHLRDAESLLGQIFSLGDKRVTTEQAELVMPHYNSNEAVELLDCLGRKDAAKAVALVNDLVDSGVNIKVFIGEIISLLRKVLLDKLSPELANNLGLDLGENLEKRLSKAVEKMSWEQITAFTRRFLETVGDNRNPLIPQLPLELAIVELCLGTGRAASTVNSAPLVPAAPPLTANRSSIPASFPVPPSLKKDKVASVSPAVQDAKIDRPVSKVNLTAAEIMAKWPEFLVKIKKYNHSLSFVLQNCVPREVKDGKLCLVFKYKFHQDRINDSGIRSIAESTLAEVFGSPLTFNSLIDENLEIRKEALTAPESSATESVSAVRTPEKTPVKTSGLMADLLKTFGGEVIN
ncbi:MAG: DNA polymerase III subunit gamma/tau [Patescibacteria group bacterium]